MDGIFPFKNFHKTVYIPQGPWYYTTISYGGVKMKFKFYYAKHKITGEFIAFTTSTTGEGDIFTAVFLSKWESDQPYLSSHEDLQRLVNGEYNDSWSYLVHDCVKKAIKQKHLEIIEIEL